MKAAVCVLVLWTLAASEPLRYDNHKIVRVIPRTKGQVDYLKTIQQQYRGHDQVDFWTYPRGVGFPVDISLSPTVFDRLYGSFSMYGLQPRVTIPDVQPLMDRQRYVPRNPLLGLEDFDYSKYHPLAEIVDWMNNLTAAYPDLVTEIKVGTSYEGRDITGLKISTGSGEDKPGFWVEGGIHAREWISPATVIYMTGQMLDKYNSDPAIKSMVDLYEWYIVPVFNVDGYEYSWTNDRMWRKTRSEQGVCRGVDPNRNWDYEWCMGGASKAPCSDLYCGPSAFSEVEVRNVSDYMKNNIPNLRVFLDMHSFSQLWMTPWGYTTDLPVDYPEQMMAADEAINALKSVYGTTYAAGSVANIIYVASGGSADWVYKKLKAKYSYGIELRDTGEYGFLLPADQIIPSGEETLKALEALAIFAANNP